VSEEVELKYDVEDLDAMAHSMDEWFPPSEGAGWQATTLTDRAFDTADFDLARAGFGARLRTTDGTTVVGLKSTIEVAGAMHRRREIEGPASERLHLFTWPASDARQLVASLAAGKELVERFHLRQHRRERAIELPDGSAWISLDDAQVLTAGGQEIGTARRSPTLAGPARRADPAERVGQPTAAVEDAARPRPGRGSRAAERR
jgi:inorganic triphosphatase YgiF